MYKGVLFTNILLKWAPPAIEAGVVSDMLSNWKEGVGSWISGVDDIDIVDA